MIDAGVLTPEDRVELIEGEILTMTPQGSAHATAMSLGHEALRAVVGPNLHVRAQLPLALGAASEPEPDFAIVTGSPRDYREHHPTSAVLVIEIADSTLAYAYRIRATALVAVGNTADGIQMCDLCSGDHISVQASHHVSRFIRLRERNYFYRSLLDRLEPRPTEPSTPVRKQL